MMATRPFSMPSARSYLTFVGAGLVSAISVVLVAGLFIDGDSGPAPSGASRQRAADIGAFLSFEQTVADLGERGGAVVIYGMKPGVADIAQANYADDVLSRMANGWLGEFEALERELATLRASVFLDDAISQLKAAFAAYSRTAGALVDATAVTGDARAALIDRAVALGSEADELYDKALATIASHRSRLGLSQKKEGS